jgi:hypothetical protein
MIEATRQLHRISLMIYARPDGPYKPPSKNIAATETFFLVCRFKFLIKGIGSVRIAISRQISMTAIETKIGGRGITYWVLSSIGLIVQNVVTLREQNMISSSRLANEPEIYIGNGRGMIKRLAYKERAYHEQTVGSENDVGAQGKGMAIFEDSLIEEDHRCLNETVDKVTDDDVREQDLNFD